MEDYYFYDKFGRIIETSNENYIGGSDLQIAEYDFEGKIAKSKQIQNFDGTPGSEIIVRLRYTYDKANRPVKTYHTINTEPEVLLVERNYNEIGSVIDKKLHSTDGTNFLQNIDYSYNARGWLKSINNTGNIGNDKFAEDLFYNVIPSGMSTTPKYDGTISAMKWRGSVFSTTKAYKFRYDEMNRLTKADHMSYGSGWISDNKYSVSNLTYDYNGNILSLDRNGKNGSGPNDYGLLDKLDYFYEGNHLIGVDDAVDDMAFYSNDFADNNANGIINVNNPSSWEYDYDDNGNMVSDLNKGIQSITHNHLNLPEQIDFGNGDKIVYLYDAAGNKLNKKVYDANILTLNMDYIGNFQYSNNSLEYIYTEEGRINCPEFQYQYMLRDHLGNVRSVVKEDGQVLQETHFYPFGMVMGGAKYETENNDYLFNTHELQEEHKLLWYDFGFRNYDAQLGRWHSPDPLASSRPDLTPNRYAYNNPVNYVDRFGLWEDEWDQYEVHNDPVDPNQDQKDPIFETDYSIQEVIINPPIDEGRVRDIGPYETFDREDDWEEEWEETDSPGEPNISANVGESLANKPFYYGFELINTDGANLANPTVFSFAPPSTGFAYSSIIVIINPALPWPGTIFAGPITPITIGRIVYNSITFGLTDARVEGGQEIETKLLDGLADPARMYFRYREQGNGSMVYGSCDRTNATYPAAVQPFTWNPAVAWQSLR